MKENLNTKEALLKHLTKIAIKNHKYSVRLMQDYDWAACVGDELASDVSDIYNRLDYLVIKARSLIIRASIQILEEEQHDAR